VRGILLAVLLGPAAFGTWALLRLGLRYSALIGFAVLRGLERELMQEDARRAPASGKESLAAAALGFILLAAGAMALLAAALAFVVSDFTHRILLLTFAAATLAEAVFGYTLVCIRVRSSLRQYAVLETGTTALHLVFAVGLASVWGLSGAFIGLLIANLLGIAAASRQVDLRLGLSLEPLRRLLRVGVPIAITIFLGILLTTVDRWVVAVLGGSTMLGYFAFAGSIAQVGTALGQVVRTVVFPQVYGQVSTEGLTPAIDAHLQRTLLPYARLLPPILGTFSLMVGPAIALWMPHYLPAIVPARFFLMAGAAVGLVSLASLGAIAGGRQQRLPLYAAVALALILGGAVLALTNGWGLGAVACATLAGHLLYAGAVLRLSLREANLRDANRLVLATLGPLVWCTMAVSLIGALLPGTDLYTAALSLGLYLVLVLPLLPAWRAEWRRFSS
jgi:O-antigen/teichoic acid export membrane protein